jgi:S-DNA-T family DNA segregation ATPase FtsK/SpoIIIE
MTDLTTLLEVGGPLAALGGGTAYTRAKYPALYWSAVGGPISTARLLSSYNSVMEACGLTVAPSRLRVLAVKATTRREVRPVPPRRGIIRPTSTGLRLRLRLAPGQEPADVAASAERLRHAWGVHAVYVNTVKPGVVELRLVGYDVLRRVRMPRKADSGFLKVPVAPREDATPFVRDYRAVPHQLTLGATLSVSPCTCVTSSLDWLNSLSRSSASTASGALNWRPSPSACPPWPPTRMKPLNCCLSWSRKWRTDTT